jgi:hypothetical protein
VSVEASPRAQDPFAIGPLMDVDTPRSVDSEALAAAVSLALRC